MMIITIYIFLALIGIVLGHIVKMSGKIKDGEPVNIKYFIFLCGLGIVLSLMNVVLSAFLTLNLPLN